MKAIRYRAILVSTGLLFGFTPQVSAETKTQFIKDQATPDFNQDKHGTTKDAPGYSPYFQGEVDVDKDMLLDWQAKHHAVTNVKGARKVNKLLKTQGYVALVLPVDKKTLLMVQAPDGFVLENFHNKKTHFLCEFVPEHQSVLKWKEFFMVQKRPFVGTLEEFFGSTLASLTSSLSKEMLKDIEIERHQIDQQSIQFIIDYPSMTSLQREIVMVRAVRGPNSLLVTKYAAKYDNQHNEKFSRAIQLPWRVKGDEAIRKIMIARAPDATEAASTQPRHKLQKAQIAE